MRNRYTVECQVARGCEDLSKPGRPMLGRAFWHASVGIVNRFFYDDENGGRDGAMQAAQDWAEGTRRANLLWQALSETDRRRYQQDYNRDDDAYDRFETVAHYALHRIAPAPVASGVGHSRTRLITWGNPCEPNES